VEKSFVKFSGLTFSQRMTVLGLSETPEQYIKKNLERLCLFKTFQRARGEKNLFSYTSMHTNFSILVLLCIKENKNTGFIIVISDNDKVVYFDRNFFRNSERLFNFLQNDISKIMNIIDDSPKGEIKLLKNSKNHFCWTYFKKKNKV
jgi:hypothetical protein